MPFNIEKMNKLPPEARFFDVNTIWYFFNGWVVRLLYGTSIKPNHITILSFILGLLSAGFYFSARSDALLWGAIFLYGKVFFDNVDGNLARVRGTSSRFGRFLDSLVDFFITVLVYLGISFYLVKTSGDITFWFLGIFGLLFCYLQSTFFVFYLVNYTSRVGSYEKNRVDENITEEDLIAAKLDKSMNWTLQLQKLFVLVYGWQDRLIERLDSTSRKLAEVSKMEETSWYMDRFFLAAISPLCLCTNNVMLAIFSIFGQVELFLILLVSLMNFYGFSFLFWKIIKWKSKVSLKLN